MSAHNDGGPEFPGKLPIYGEVADEFAYFGGMTLRDYFAAKAMQGFLAEAANPRFGSSAEPPNAAHWPGFASDAYALADAMLAARGEA